MTAAPTAIGSARSGFIGFASLARHTTTDMAQTPDSQHVKNRELGHWRLKGQIIAGCLSGSLQQIADWVQQLNEEECARMRETSALWNTWRRMQEHRNLTGHILSVWPVPPNALSNPNKLTSTPGQPCRKHPFLAE